MTDIKDTEIRFIGDDKSYDSSQTVNKSRQGKNGLNRMESPAQSMRMNSRHFSNRRSLNSFIVILLCLIFVGVSAWIFVRSCTNDRIEKDIAFGEERIKEIDNPTNAQEQIPSCFETPPAEPSREVLNGLLKKDQENSHISYCQIKESSINDIPFRIIMPVNAVPELHIGELKNNDSTIILAMQAADIRKDNGQIVGACVNKGEVVSKGLAKKGYVAIIAGKINIGVSEHSPLFEEAIEKNGDFFRQYPIVSKGMIVENNLKNLSIRRAICERSGDIFIAETKIPVSFHDFSQMLVDFQVNDAVYLVGSQYACGFSRDENDFLSTWGESQFSKAKNISYLVWRKQK